MPCLSLFWTVSSEGLKTTERNDKAGEVVEQKFPDFSFCHPESFAMNIALIGNRPNTVVSESTVSNTELSEFFGAQ